LVLVAVLLAGFALAFKVAPELDLTVARFFHDPATGFSLAGHRGWDRVIFANKLASYLFTVAALVLLPVALLPRFSVDIVAMRYLAFVILLYLVGPGLLVNGILKRVYGRARPVQITAFGGDGPFTGPWEVSEYCRSACSFISAEVAAGTALTVALVIGALWFKGRRAVLSLRIAALASVVLLVLVAIQRVGSGRHYLSDVIFSILLIAALGVALSCLLWPQPARSAAAQPSGPTG
jgi:lipid A 4'-phosphatase